MNGKERISRILKHQPVDRIGLFEHFWGDTEKVWRAQGKIPRGQRLEDHFGFDMQLCWPFNSVADLDFGLVTVEETAETILQRDGNGALLRRHKLHNATPEHVDFAVRDREGWERLIKPKLTPDPRRINFEAYREARTAAAKAGRFFCWSGVNVFELMHPVCGHEHMLVGMLDDPAWVRDMVETYATLVIELQKTLFEREGLPDGIWFYEDMGFKHRPFMSLEMYRDIVQPGHLRTIAHAHELGLPVIMHSCGFVEPLLPGMIEAGIDALQVIEVKAGMDLLRIHREWGKRIALIGGMDVRALYSNDRAVIDAELESKIPAVKEGYGYVLHSDHSIPDTVHYDSYRYFVDRGLELGAYASDQKPSNQAAASASHPTPSM